MCLSVEISGNAAIVIFVIFMHWLFFFSSANIVSILSFNSNDLHHGH